MIYFGIKATWILHRGGGGVLGLFLLWFAPGDGSAELRFSTRGISSVHFSGHNLQDVERRDLIGCLHVCGWSVKNFLFLLKEPVLGHL